MSLRTSIHSNYYNKIASTYENRFGKKDCLTKVQSDLLSSITPGSSLLELGTGTGLLLSSLERSTSYKYIVGLDLSSSMLAIASKRLNYSSLILGDSHSLPFKAKSFDTVVCSYLVQYCSLHNLLSEINRVLKLGGLFSILEVNSTSPQGLFFGNSIVRRLIGRPSFVRFYTKKFLTDMLSLYGLVITSSFYSGVFSGSIILKGYKSF